MSTNKTQHYHLNQWEVEDKVLRAEFNQDNAKLDSALAQAAQERAERSDPKPQNVTGADKGEGAGRHTKPQGVSAQAGP